LKGEVQREPDGSGAKRPEPEHRFAGRADPEERGAALRQLERERQTDHVAVEGDGAAEVAHGEVSLEEAGCRDWLAHGCTRLGTGHSRATGTCANGW
jgi:hypothetical protein